MKYLAILKDSLREALDSKVLIVLIVLSTLVIVFVLSLSFKPLSARRTMEQFFSSEFGGPPQMTMTLNARKPEKWVTSKIPWRAYQLIDVELAKGEADSPLSEYVLTVGKDRPQDELTFAVLGSLADLTKGPERQWDRQNIRKLFADAEELGFIQADEVEALEPKGDDGVGPMVYRMTVRGTPSTHRIWASAPGLLFGMFTFEWMAAPLGAQIYNLASLVLKTGSLIAVLMGVVITSFFIPNMMQKGTVDLLLVKPIQRWALLCYKYVGGLMFIFLSTAYAVVGIWFVLGIRSGLWANGMLLLVFTLTFFFAILYAVSTFIGVMTRSTVTSILVTIGAWALFAIIGMVHDGFEGWSRMEEAMKVAENKRWGDGYTAKTVHVIHAITPRTEDLNVLNDLIVFTDFMSGSIADMGKYDNGKRNWWESLAVSGMWIAIFLGLGCLWITFKDY